MRRFSFAACWLLSAFTSGMIAKGTCSTRTISAVGTVPPIIRMRTGSGVVPKVSVRAL